MHSFHFFHLISSHFTSFQTSIAWNDEESEPNSASLLCNSNVKNKKNDNGDPNDDNNDNNDINEWSEVDSGIEPEAGDEDDDDDDDNENAGRALNGLFPHRRSVLSKHSAVIQNTMKFGQKHSTVPRASERTIERSGAR